MEGGSQHGSLDAAAFQHLSHEQCDSARGVRVALLTPRLCLGIPICFTLEVIIIHTQSHVRARSSQLVIITNLALCVYDHPRR